MKSKVNIQAEHCQRHFRDTSIIHKDIFPCSNYDTTFVEAAWNGGWDYFLNCHWDAGCFTQKNARIRTILPSFQSYWNKLLDTLLVNIMISNFLPLLLHFLGYILSFIIFLIFAKSSYTTWSRRVAWFSGLWILHACKLTQMRKYQYKGSEIMVYRKWNNGVHEVRIPTSWQHYFCSKCGNCSFLKCLLIFNMKEVISIPKHVKSICRFTTRNSTNTI